MKKIKNFKIKEWLPIYHDCGWKGEVNLDWAKKEFQKKIREGPKEFAYDLIIKCRGCGAVQGLRYACIAGNCFCCNEKKNPN